MESHLTEKVDCTDLERTGFSRIWVEGDSVYKKYPERSRLQTGDER